MNKIIIILLLFCSGYLFSQEYNVRFITPEIGPKSLSIYDMAVDEQETLWLGTSLGLKQFDGYNFADYPIPGYERKSIVKVVHLKNHLYILYKEGNGILIDLNLANGKYRRVIDRNILDFHIAQDKMVLLDKDLNVILFEGKKKTLYLPDFGKRKPILDYDKSYGIIYYNHAIYFTANNTGIWQIKGNRLTNIYPEAVGFKDQFKIFNNKLYFTDTSIDIDKNHNIIKVKPTANQESYYTDFTIFKNGFYFIKHEKTLFKREKGSITTLLASSENRDLRKFVFIGENIYVASSTGLIEISKKYKAISSFDLNRLNSIKRKILVDGDRVLFFGHPTIISLTKDKKTEVLNPSYGVYDALKIKNEFYLVSEGMGLQVSDRNFRKISPVYREPTENTISLYYDNANDVVYFGGNKHLLFFRPSKKKIQKVAHPFPGHTIKCIVTDAQRNRVFAGTEEGLFMWEPQKKKITKLIQNRFIGALHLDAQRQLLWVGTENGMLAYHLADFTLLKRLPMNFLKNPKVASILEDDRGRIWASTFSGLAAYDHNKDILLEINSSYLLNEEYNFKSACKLNNGKLLFGGLQGYDEIDPRLFSFSTSGISGRVSGYQIIKKGQTQQQIYRQGQKIKIQNRGEFLKIFFTTKKEINKTQSNFQYKLDNTEWIDLKQKYVELVGLAKGRYLLQIRGYDEMGRLIKFLPVNVEVTEEFYKSDTFLFLLIITLCLLLILSLNMAITRLRMKNDIYEKVSMDLHDEVGTLLSKTSLLMSQKRKLEEEHMMRIRENIKQANFGLRAYINSIKEEEQQLIYIYYEAVEIMEGFLNVKKIGYTYSFSGDKSLKINPALLKDLKLCFYEIFNNTIKYSTTDRVSLKFEENNRLLTITVCEENNFFDMESIRFGGGIKNIEKRMMRNYGEAHFLNDEQNKSYTVALKIRL